MDLARDQRDLQLIRARDNKVTCRILCILEKELRGFLWKYGRKYVSCAGEYASIAITILLEKGEELVLTCALLTFLNSIARKQFLKDLDKHDELVLNEGYVNERAVADDIYEEIEKNERKLLVHKCLCELDKRCQKILDLFLKDLSSKAAASKMAYKSGEVYNVKKSECYKKLKYRMKRKRECRELFDFEEEQE